MNSLDPVLAVIETLTIEQRQAVYDWLGSEADWEDFLPSYLWEKTFLKDDVPG